MNQTSIIIIGGGQSGLAAGYFLQRSKVPFVILDGQPQPGGAWQQGWESLRLFSPAEHSSLPGWLMPKGEQGNPSRQEVIDYLSQYEQRYKLPVQRPVTVGQVNRMEAGYELQTSAGTWQAKAVISATGTWSKPFIPDYPGLEVFKGKQVHSAFYRYPEEVAGQRVAVIGGGNSAAQILAEVSEVATTTWFTLEPPKFLPDEVDGRYLFEFATRQYKAKLEGKKLEPSGGLGDIVMVESVKAARERGVLVTQPVFEHFTERGVVLADGSTQDFDAVIWCTGFRAALDHLAPLNVIEPNGGIELQGNQSVKSPGLWLLGYGAWTGFASATLIGVGRTAKEVAAEACRSLGI